MKLISTRQLIEKVNASRASIWRWEKAGLFPRRRQIGPGRVGWLESEVDEFIKSRPAVGESGAAK